MKRIEVSSYVATIFIAGDYFKAESCCRQYCDDTGFCVTVEPTCYVYTDGEEQGVRVGIINYGRFPSTPEDLFARAETLALKLLKDLGQDSVSVVGCDRTVWFSRRNDVG